MASSPTRFIELNGKRYDARTGRQMPAHEEVTQNDRTFVKPAVAQSGVALDGFTKRVVRKPKSDAAVRSAQRKAERSKTLMRHAVKKPASQAVKPDKVVRTRPAPRLDIDPQRASRAQKVPKSRLVSRFSAAADTKPRAAVLPVQPEPGTRQKSPLLEQHHELFATNTSTHKQALQKAIHEATGHTQPRIQRATARQKISKKLRVGNRTVNIAAASLATVLLAGFVAYQNVPNLSMRVATTRAGVQGTLPSYWPSGFGMKGPIQYQPGQITIGFKSNSDDRAFQVNQRSSQWNSDTLLESFVATNQRSYQTFQDSGKTIYIYDQNNATWVDGGVWYQIEGNSSLNSDQLLRMAASM